MDLVLNFAIFFYSVLFCCYSTTTNDSIMEQSTSNSNNQRVLKKKNKTSKLCPGFDDFVPLQPIKAQYKGHRNTR